MNRHRKAVILLLDGVGVGALPDSKAFGDDGANTLAHVDEAVGGLEIPNLARWGLARIAELKRQPRTRPEAAHGKMAETSAGKDSTTGHWELAGLPLESPFPTYPRGFPESILERFREATGTEVLGNVPASGTEIIERLGPEHVRTGLPILYTSADSVFQLAAHVDVLPLDELYRLCRTARDLLSNPPHNVGRVIARPFRGTEGSYHRTADRKDFSLPPPGPTLIDALAAEGARVVGIGKVGSLFAYRGFSRSEETVSNDDGMKKTAETLERGTFDLLFVNLVDFDTLWGHRNDPRGFARALEELDRWLPTFRDQIETGTLTIITADHGNDPTHPGTDHTREYVPVMAAIRGTSPVSTELGIRGTFSDVAATLSEHFELQTSFPGESFLDALKGMP